MADVPATVLLTGLSVDGERLLVLPREWCLSEVSLHGTLEHSRTYGDVRKDAGAWGLVEDEMADYLRRLYENGEIEEDVSERTARRRYASASSPFEADSFFADEEQRWRPDAYLSTEQWLTDTEPELAEVFCESDTGWGINYTPSWFVPAESRELFERLLIRLGYRIQHLTDLHDLYLNSPAGRRAVQARLRNAKPVRPTKRKLSFTGNA